MVPFLADVLLGLGSEGRVILLGTARDQVLAAVERLSQRGQDTFTVADVVAEVRRSGSRLAESTIRTHVVSRMCANAPDHHGTTYDDLERVDRGVYRLRR